ncbi:MULTISPECIES: intradiol ring-cleavage dioxygenase [Streptomyces]|uniref:Protocatechuate dioxygenase n=2 Tax=Streptomyces TaxID=1883 RepID=A0A3M8EXX8_9ACTN|nr:MULTISPECIES: intradiol ring-cleavage dioxygenase [Streptomyces]KNE83205.1 protocatechuate dioxygenase [Streptomyces fradiae]OFA54409.1 protocatechuate dioxygenase [Streptomyces fradiae]PQM20843.1 protocatechuate dioxygenase [Streptomyces xinghaiensis]RKM95840.1 protocatechuate dioxygenase [Streptomyces xinghaiensis]RNC70820.1 protocatechuate dioxygenase [Streptomyces xinghaiensis]
MTDNPQLPFPRRANTGKHRRKSPVSRRRVIIGGSAAAAATGLGLAGMASAGGSSGGAGAAGSAGGASGLGVCSLTAEVTEGPYALPGALIRNEISEDRPGFPVHYLLTVVDQSAGCAPLPDALVELWHADHLGEYSGFVGRNGHPGEDNGTFCRGGAVTDENGQVELVSIWPGHYTARAVHAHLRVHTDITPTGGSYTGGEIVHTGQLYFDPDTNDRVQAAGPYRENTTPETHLYDDGVYDGGGSASGLLTLTPLGGSPAEGYAATLTIGVNA